MINTVELNNSTLPLHKREYENTPMLDKFNKKLSTCSMNSWQCSRLEWESKYENVCNIQNM